MHGHPGVFDNLGLLGKDMNRIKEKMEDIRQDFDHLSKTSRGELTFDQHLDKLTKGDL